MSKRCLHLANFLDLHSYLAGHSLQILVTSFCAQLTLIMCLACRKPDRFTATLWAGKAEEDLTQNKVANTSFRARPKVARAQKIV